MAFDPTTAVPDESPSQFDPSTAKPVNSSTLRKAADLPLGFASGALGATRALSDAFGAGNVVSRGLKSAGEGVDSLLTPEAQDAQYRQSQILDEAKGKGFGAQIAAGGRAFMEAPVQTAVQGLGSVVPMLATAAIPGALPARVAAGAMGAGMGVGTAKGAIRDEVEKRELGAGKTPDQAAAAADAAQAYSGPNTDQIALGGALGVADAAFGVAPAAVGMLRRKLGREAVEQVAGQAGEGIIKAGLKGAAKEMPVEFAQGGQEQVAANVAAQRAGYEAGTFDGAVAQGSFEALASGGPGAGFGILNRQRETPAVPPAIQPQAGTAEPAAPPTAPAGPSADATAISQEQAGGLQRTFDPRAGVSPPLSLTPLNTEGGISYEEPAPKPFGQNFTTPNGEALRTALPERPSVAMGLDPALGGLTAAAALAVDSGASPATQGFGIRRRAADFTDVTPITAAAGQIETPRRLGDSPVFDVQAREVNTDQPGIAAARRLPFTNPGAPNGPQAQEALTSEPRSEEAPAAGVSNVARPTAEQRARNLAALKQRMQAGRAQPPAADAAGSQPLPPAQGQDAGALSGDANVQNAPQPAAAAQAKTPAGEAPAPAGRDAAPASGVPAAPGAGDVQADGVTTPAWADMTPDQRKRSRLEQEIATGKTNNGGVMATLRPSAIEKRKQELAQMGDAGRMPDVSKNPSNLNTFAEPAQKTAKSEQVAAQGVPEKARSAEMKKLAADIQKSADNLTKMGEAFSKQSKDGFSRARTTTYNARAGSEAERQKASKKMLSKLVRSALRDGQQVPQEILDAAGSGVDYNDAGKYEPVSTPTAPPAPKPDAGPELLGRNSQPLSEGGKPFKTEADAKAAKKLHPTKRVIKAEGGFVLAPKTPKQIAADAEKAKRLRQFNSGTPGKPMSAHEFIVSEGGMSAAARSELGVDGNPRVGNRTLFAGQGKPGLTLEQAAMKLKQAGYITDESESAAADIIKRSLNNPQYTPEGVEAVAEAEREAEFQDYLNAAQEPVDENADDFDPFGPSPDFSPAELADAGYDEATAKIKAEVDALIAMAEAQGIDTETLREDAARATADQTEQEYYEQARSAINAAISQSAASRRSDSAVRDGQGQQGEAQRGGGEDRVAPAGEQGGEGLTAPTRADIEAQQARAEQAANSKAAKDKADAAREAKERERADVKRLSEAAANTFELGGDAMANLTGQTDIFGSAPEAAPAPASAPQADDLDAMFDDLMGEVAPAPAAPKATELTPKQFHEAKLAYIAADTGASMAEVRENYDTDGGRAEHQREWLRDVEQAAKSGSALTRQTLDKLYEIAPNARLPEAAFPQGYQRPEARKAEAAEKQVRKAAPRTASQATASAAKNTASALNNAIDGLGALFGANSKGRLGSGLSFDENTYQQAKPLFIQAIANLKDAGADIREAMRAVIKMVVDKFGADTATNMKPYIVRFTSDVRDGTITQEDINAASADTNLERDSRQPAAEPAVGDPVPGDTRGAASDAGQDDAQGDGQPGLTRIQADGTPADRKRGDQRVSDRVGQAGIEEFDAGADIGEPSGATGDTGIPPEPIPASAVVSAAEGGIAKQRALYQQRQAESVAVKAGDLANIKATLPYLLEGQQEDVLKAETRFAKEDGYGMLFTNGTGTGKTFSGLGVVKRFAKQGKTNTLIVVPDEKIMSDWIESAKALGLTATQLKDTKDAGSGITVTTYANMGANDALASRNWDLVVADEAHTLMMSADGKMTGYLQNLRAITMHPDGAYQRYVMQNRADIDRLTALATQITNNNKVLNNLDTMDAMLEAVRSENAKLQAQADKLDTKLRAIRDKVREQVDTSQGAKRTRAVFLSATPFAYEKTVDWANGYLFDYNEGREAEGARSRRYNEGSNREKFFMQNFGYSMRYGKLTEPDSKLVDRGLMQRQFNAMLKKRGSLSGRVLDVPADYDRRFVLLNSAIGNEIDNAITWIEENRKAHNQLHKDAKKGETPPNGYDFMQTSLNELLYGPQGHLLRRYLLEAIKAKEVVPIIREHLAMGRKVVVFHDFKKGGSVNPFKFMPRPEPSEKEVANPLVAASLPAIRAYNKAVAEFDAKFPRLSGGLDLAGLLSPVERFTKEFPGVLLINGDEKKSDLLQRYKTFNDDATGPVVALVQSAKNKGWSGHDTTGKHQRVLFNLGLPTQPTMSIQQEGRIYRTGQVSNAIFRYLNTGTNWERWAFAQTIADRASAAENLGSGELSRALKDAFISGFEESDTYAPGHEGEGTGGKERDKASNNAMSEWDRAKSFYFGTQKKNSRTKAQEGTDYFATPEPIGLKMVQWLKLRGGESALEPSGGHGAIARWIPETASRTVIEPSSALRSRLAMVMNPAEDRILDGQFEDLDVVNKFDGIAMNPPFGTAGRMAIDHLAKAATHLRDGGRIVAIIPTGPAADKRFDQWFYEDSAKPAKPLFDMAGTKLYAGDTLHFKAFGREFSMKLGRIAVSNGVQYAVPEGGKLENGINLTVGGFDRVEPGPRTETFRPAKDLHLVADIKMPGVTFERAGTTVATRIVVIEKQTDSALAPDPKSFDFTGADNIATLFDRMENIDLPERKMTAAQQAKAEAGAEKQKATPAKDRSAKKQPEPVVERGDAEIITYTTKAGKELRGIIRTDLTKEQAQKIDPYTWKMQGGFFIREKYLKPAADAPAFSRNAPTQTGSGSTEVRLKRDDDSALGDIINIDGKDRPATNSNGQPIHPTEEGVRNFWKWFGDSRVVDSQGRPLVVYHGTDKKFNEFKPQEGLRGNALTGDMRTVNPEVFYFTPDEDYAKSYGEAKNSVENYLMPVYLRAKWRANLTSFADIEEFTNDTEQEFEDQEKQFWQYLEDDEFRKKFLAEWDDGSGNTVAVFESYEGTEYAVFDPTQIKSAAGNTGAFSPNNPDIRFSQGTPAQGIPISTARQITDLIRARWANAPEIVVAANMQDPAVPERVRQEDAKQRSQGASGEPEGFYYGGKVYLVASALNKPADVVRVLFHEALGHAGLRGVFGESLTPILKQLAVLRRADVAAKASEYGLNMSIEAERLQAAEEVLAVMAETKPELGYVQRAVAAIRAFLRKNIPGFAAMKLTDAEIINSFILPARRFVERGPGGGPRGGMPAPAFSRTDIRSSRANAGTAGVADQIRQFDVAGKTGNTLAHYRGMSLQALGRRQLVDLYQQELPQLTEYDRLVQNMEAEKNDTGAEADGLAREWAKLDEKPLFGPAKYPGMERKLAELMHDATLAKIDPQKDYQAGDDKAQWTALRAKYNALSPKAQALYVQARDMYATHYAKVRKAIAERIERSEMSDSQKKQTMARMDDDFFKKTKGVYFPLARFGSYVMVVKDANGEVVNVSRAETLNEAETTRKQLQQVFPRDGGFNVSKVLKDAEFNPGRDAVGKGFMADLLNVLDKQGVDDALRDSVSQLYLASLPDLSWAKHGIHRKGTPGFSQDARRAFAQNMFHGARHLAKLRYADRLQGQLADMENHIKAYREIEEYDSVKAQQVLDEMVKRHENLMNPKTNPLSTALTSIGFVFYLGISPAAAMVNLSQTALVAFPIMGAKWGFGKASAALLRASKETVAAKNDISKVLQGDELAAYEKAVKDGTIDVTMAHDLAGISQGEDAKVTRAMRPVMRAASFLFHHAERFNRQATFIASFRLAKEAGADNARAFEEAKKATYDGHFDYGAANRPRVMQGNVAKVVLLFKQYGQNMVYTLSRQAYLSMKGLTPADRAEARKQLSGILALHAAAAGALGLPLVGALLGAASFIGGDDDEPWDAEVALKNAMTDAMGPKAAEVMAHGLSRLTPWDLSGRVALDRLILPDVREGLEGQDYAEAMMIAAIGPVGGIFTGMAKGLQSMSDGKYGRGLEEMLPVALRNPIKAIRYAEEGAVDKSGVVIKDEVSLSGVLGQASGFAPSEVRLATEGKSAIYQHDKARMDRRKTLVAQFAQAQMAGDTEGMAEVRQDIERFNSKNPTRRITPLNLMQSVRARQRRIDGAEQGVYLPKNRRDAMEAGRFAAEAAL